MRESVGAVDWASEEMLDHGAYKRSPSSGGRLD